MASFKDQFSQRLQEARRIAADPARARTTHRAAGFWLTLIGVAVTVGDYVLYTQSGRIWVILLAINIVTLGAGVFMLMTGRNPFARF